MSRAPVPLIELADLTAGERALLDAGRTIPAVDYDQAAGEARFLAGLALATSAGSSEARVRTTHQTVGASQATSGKGLLAKLAVKVLVGLGVGATLVGAGVVAGRRMAPRAVPVTVAPAPSTPTPAEQSQVAPAPEPAPAPAPAPEPAPAPAPARRASPTARAHGAASADAVPIPAPPEIPRAPATDSLAELRAVALARSLLDRDPEGALRVLDKLRRDHATGYFAQERQALTVLALAGAGQSVAARQHAAAFLAAYPNGPLSDRVRAVLTDSE